MKQYTNEIQTAKLIELGFEEPKSVTHISWRENEKGNPIINADVIKYTRHYSIDELIEMLPKEINGFSVQMYHAGLWSVSYPMYEDKYYVAAYELCDALFEMLRYLKEQGLI